MTERPVRRVVVGAADEAEAVLDAVVVEEPLELRVGGETLAVTMRTPGEDARLALGFLFAEGLLASVDDAASLRVEGNAVEVELRAPEAAREARFRRGTLTTAACGVCGRRTIADLLGRIRPLAQGPVLAAARLAESVARLRESQPNFRRTGGIHGAAALDAALAVVAAAEDVGRHNAVDKVVGALLQSRAVPGAPPAVLVVSGRTSFEIVQKAAAAGIPIVAGVSAPSSLGIDLALAAGITLAGFVREGRLNIYAHPERLAGGYP